MKRGNEGQNYDFSEKKLLSKCPVLLGLKHLQDSLKRRFQN